MTDPKVNNHQSEPVQFLGDIILACESTVPKELIELKKEIDKAKKALENKQERFDKLEKLHKALGLPQIELK